MAEIVKEINTLETLTNITQQCIDISVDLSYKVINNTNETIKNYTNIEAYSIIELLQDSIIEIKADVKEVSTNLSKPEHLKTITNNLRWVLSRNDLLSIQVNNTNKNIVSLKHINGVPSGALSLKCVFDTYKPQVYQNTTTTEELIKTEQILDSSTNEVVTEKQYYNKQDTKHYIEYVYRLYDENAVFITSIQPIMLNILHEDVRINNNVLTKIFKSNEQDNINDNTNNNTNNTEENEHSFIPIYGVLNPFDDYNSDLISKYDMIVETNIIPNINNLVINRSSSTENVAIIDENGFIKFKGFGETTIQIDIERYIYATNLKGKDNKNVSVNITCLPVSEKFILQIVPDDRWYNNINNTLSHINSSINDSINQINSINESIIISYNTITDVLSTGINNLQDELSYTIYDTSDRFITNYIENEKQFKELFASYTVSFMNAHRAFNNDYNKNEKQFQELFASYTTSFMNAHKAFNNDYNKNEKQFQELFASYTTEIIKKLNWNNSDLINKLDEIKQSLHTDMLLMNTSLTVMTSLIVKNISDLSVALSTNLQTIDKTLNRRVPTKKELLYNVTSEMYKYASFDKTSPNEIVKKSMHKSNMLWNELVKAKICDGQAVELPEEIKCQKLTILYDNKVIDDNDTITIKYSKNKTIQLNSNIIPNNASNQKLEWKSMDESVITIDSNGKATCKNTGDTIIMVNTTDGTLLTKNIQIKINK